MSPPAAWHGTEAQINALLAVLRRDCGDCVIAARVLGSYGLCQMHRAMLDDQRWLDGLIIEQRAQVGADRAGGEGVRTKVWVKPESCPKCRAAMLAEEDEDGVVILKCQSCGTEKLPQAVATMAPPATPARPLNGHAPPADEWEWFDPRRAALRVAINPKGQLYAPALAGELLGNPTRVELAVSRDRRHIACRPARDESRSFALTRQGKGRGCLISLKSLLEFHGLMPSTSVKVKARFDGGVLVIPVEWSTGGE